MTHVCPNRPLLVQCVQVDRVGDKVALADVTNVDRLEEQCKDTVSEDLDTRGWGGHSGNKRKAKEPVVSGKPRGKQLRSGKGSERVRPSVRLQETVSLRTSWREHVHASTAG